MGGEFTSSVLPGGPAPSVYGPEFRNFGGAYFGEAGIDYERRLSEKAKLEITPNIGWAPAKLNEANIGVPKAASIWWPWKAH